MDESLIFFKELLKMTMFMVEEIIPDVLLHVDLGTLENLMKVSQDASIRFQVFAKLCGVLSRQNLRSPGSDLATKPARLEEEVGFQQATSSSGGDNKSIVSDFSDLSTHSDEVWKTLLADARIWYATHNKTLMPCVFYCGVCNKQAKTDEDWEAHMGGRTHLKLIPGVEAVNLTCDVCGLHVCGEFELLNFIISSEEHRVLDTLVCGNQHSSDPSVASGCSSKDTPKEPESVISGLSELKVVSAPSSVECDEVVSQSPESFKQNPTVFQNTEMRPNFVDSMTTIAMCLENHDPFEIAYCLPCEVICESKQLWKEHKATLKHNDYLNSQNLHLCRCLQCEFVVTGDPEVATIYMKYHIEICHQQSTEGIKIDEYMEMKNLVLVGKIQKQELVEASAVNAGENIKPSGTVAQESKALPQYLDNFWKDLILEAKSWFEIHKKIPAMFYCGICNVRAKSKHIWAAHLGGRNHKSLYTSPNYITEPACVTCGFVVCGSSELLHAINASAEHHALHSLVINAQVGYSASSSETTSKSQEESVISAPPASSQSLIPPKVVGQRPRTSKVMFQNTEIHADFVSLTNRVAGYIENHEPFAVAYCRPCETICESKQIWKAHKAMTKHRGKMSSRHYNNVLCRCLQCEFVVTARLKISTQYMKYHIEVCHHQSTYGVKIEEYMEVKSLVSGGKVPNELGSTAGSLKGSSETVYSVHNSLDLPTSSTGDTSRAVTPSIHPSTENLPGLNPRHHGDLSPSPSCSSRASKRAPPKSVKSFRFSR